MRTTETHTLGGSYIRETAKALQFQVETIDGQLIEGGELKTEWFPFSQVSQIFKSKDAGEDKIVVSKWICEQKELV